MFTLESIVSSINNYFYPEEVPAAGPIAPPSPMAHDTVSPASNLLHAEWRPERPRITPPSELPRHSSLSEYRLLAVTSDTQTLGGAILDTLSYRLQGAKDKIREVSSENMAKLREAAKRASKSDFWSVLKKIATSLLSALSAVFGITILATGGSALVGGAMIASGILSLANFALSELGTWDWIADYIAQDNEDLKKKLAIALPLSVGIVAAGIGLVGTVNGVATGAFNLAEKILSSAHTVVSVSHSVATFAKANADANLIKIQADLKAIQALFTVEQENFTSIINEIKGSMGEFKNIKAKTKKAIEMIAQSNIDLVRQA